MNTPPPCPLTGAAPVRHIQSITRKLFVQLWKYSFGVDVSGLITRPLNLWESPCGLIYFDPLVAGDDAFYQALYQQAELARWLRAGACARLDHLIASRHILEGWQVLDVGCGAASFQKAIPNAIYFGLDPYADEEALKAGVLKQSLAEHAMQKPGFYDAVCAFHVIEHIADPKAFVKQSLTLLKPGGLLILASPVWPSVETQLPNFVFNAPPHHLTWWSPKAYISLCERFGLTPIEITPIRGAESNLKLRWMGKLCPIKAQGPYFQHDYVWHLSLLWANIASAIARCLPIKPKASDDEEIICIAQTRKAEPRTGLH